MIIAILQARVTSSRLPGKVLKPILGIPMLVHQIERIKQTKMIDRLLVATSLDITDDPIEQCCQQIGIECFRGKLDDVLDRFYQTASSIFPEHIVRLTGDCPLCDPELIDKIIIHHLTGNFDYTSNTVKATFPDGLDVEIFRFSCLEQAWKEANLPSQREHVTPFIHSQPHRFHVGQYQNNVDLSYLRWTVDEPLDFELVSIIYEALYPVNPAFSTQEILEFLDKSSHLKTINTSYIRNEGWQKSLLADELFLNKNIGN
ncbi:cytidylyltransferase domain-containing protein [Nostoc sp. TCL26-01]|uniref:cytidylyltransferase domain-containing protein n=1 Tax=Nostoc sp. TCL26-01 TaxID=2576904 RepID=UPI0015B89B72|nr:glycosyltransferase family protein [Nostoc sp. TCL26-01]QLE59138.1 spore coat protein [Nostoc sp. TCL26-01]